MASQDEAYKSIIKDRVDKLKERINKLETKEFDRIRKRNHKFSGGTRNLPPRDKTINRRKEKIAGLKEELEALEAMVNDKNLVRDFDVSDRKERKLDKLDASFNRIQGLVASTSDEETKNRLVKQGVSITATQYKMLIPKATLHLIKKSFLLREQGKRKYLAEIGPINDGQAFANEAEPNPIKKGINKVRIAYVRNKIGRRDEYRKKKEISFQDWENKNIAVLYGTSIIVMAKEVVERISRRKSTQQQPQQTR